MRIFFAKFGEEQTFKNYFKKKIMKTEKNIPEMSQDR